MTKIFLPILSVIFLASLIVVIGRIIHSGFSAIGRRFKRPPAPKRTETNLEKTMKASDEMIIRTAESSEVLTEEPKLVGSETMVRAMRILEDTDLFEPYPRLNTAAVRQTIEEVDFYIEQDLLTDARIALDELTKRAPGHLLLRHRLYRLNRVAKINRPGVIPPDDQLTRIVDYTQLAASRAAAK